MNQANTPQTTQSILDSQEKVWQCSPFVAKYCQQRPDSYNDLVESGDLLTDHIDHSVRLAAQLADVDDENSLMRILRLYRQREMVRIAWRDLAAWADLKETLKSLSDLADTMIEVALNWLYPRVTAQLGTPYYPNTETSMSMTVLALGKLGGQELNFSSDIDLIFAYPEAGETVGVKRARSHQEFFLRLGQKLITALNQITADGFVFRVDMRLRPFGDSGPLVTNFSAMEDYYQTNARDWERYALVKARTVVGDDSLLTSLRPFIYRRYLDYNAFESLRDLKAKIDQEANRKGMTDNLKLGRGGIREVEFVCQVFQLIRGGRLVDLQQRHLLTSLIQIEKHQLLPKEIIDGLREAYYFLRLSENHLQEIDDRQTQALPTDEENQKRLAYSMGYSTWSDFLKELQHHQQNVQAIFTEVIAPVNSEEQQKIDHWQLINKLDQAEALTKQLQQLLDSARINNLSQNGREKVDTLIPLLIAAAVEQNNQYDAIHRALKFLEAVAQRTVYLSLLIERPQVLKQLICFCAESAWIAEQITRYPILLDELLDSRQFKPNEFNIQLPADDLEMQMDRLRQFKRAHVLHIAAGELSGKFSIEVTSDYLTALAEALVKHSLKIAKDYLHQKHGQLTEKVGFCVVAYGKAGGIELTYGSDLDLVFLYDYKDKSISTNGNKPLDHNIFFLRLAQRLIHIINTTTSAGTLYEIDSRLRPNGASSLLVHNLKSFETYQQQDAWIWEHQALVRARAIAGDAETMAEFEQIRRKILSQPSDIEKLKQAIIEMRDKMRQQLDKSKTGKQFDLKQGKGGIVDIEFLVQYGVLRWAPEHPDLLDTTGVLPSLKLFAKYQIFDEQATEQLSEAYRTYRAATHQLVLQNKKALVGDDKYVEHREAVALWWGVNLQH
jgi:glutamate-ammonia-ligase adenylyltransferase